MSNNNVKKPHGGINNNCPDNVREGLTVEDIKQSFLDNLRYHLGSTPLSASKNDLYTALALVVRERIFRQHFYSLENYSESENRIVAYLSAEFLPGPHLSNNLFNLGITEQAREALSSFAIDLDDLIEQEEEPGLGNGGLGRLASCYLDSLATLSIPAVGYGIRYEFGIFDQEIRGGWQVEITDKWLRKGNPWEIIRPNLSYKVKLGGYTEAWTDRKERLRVRWIPDTVVKGVAYDTPVLGYKAHSANPLRLWKAEAIESFDFSAFNHGDYYMAVQDKMFSENITKVLYPNDESTSGKVLRLEQQFFFVTCSLQDMIRVHLLIGRKLKDFHKKWAIQLNDTHPSLAVAELMRLLIDKHLMDWDTAWNVTCNTFAYTNHTLLPEALEKWPVPLFGKLLPRHLEIIYEINSRFLEIVKKVFPGDDGKLSRMSLIDESGDRYVRMANLATVGSSKVNGVARLHSELLKDTVLNDFADLWPEKFCNITNGVTPRRFAGMSNPGLKKLLDEKTSKEWLNDLSVLKELESFINDKNFLKEWRKIKLSVKKRLSVIIEQRTGVQVDPESLFDVQAKRIHEYKRQHLNVLHILTLYLRLKQNPELNISKRTFIFGGKAAPGYYMAKLIIKLINSVADIVNNDPDVNGCLKVVFFPDYNVTNAQNVYPAADLSEQISTAGKEASGTGNMKFSLNGALTIGTLDGANVEIREEVGEENFFLFGLTAAEVQEVKSKGYNPYVYYEQNTELRGVIDFIRSGALVGGDTELFRPLIDNLLHNDPYLLFADYQSYIDCQDQVGKLWQNQAEWTRKSILNTARMGKFSSDRSIREYCNLIWHV
ncbi:MAG: glycogen/starch/alpha-glucan phosphorylase [Bacteroidia bacterium]|nr:glycogen/starch/alpha-glucan phosphorylase [Bacteroidia bacterium]